MLEELPVAFKRTVPASTIVTPMSATQGLP
jgi:hypothetical protein